MEDVARSFDAVDAWHLQVHEDHVRLQARRLRYGFFTAHRLSYNLSIG